MEECPTVQELAGFVEEGRAPSEVREHIAACEACQNSLQTLGQEIRALQISISDLWFRERISCPGAADLAAYRAGRLSGEERAYIRFHLEELGCPFCGDDAEGEEGRQGRPGGAGIVADLLREIRDSGRGDARR